MTNAIESYRKVEYKLPETERCWQLSGAGFDKMERVEIPRRKPGPDEI
ncbi:MAG: hypothetical protein H3C63_07355, partial [Candidatus Omnitrophica bacterium]|nr:hypothetical protein [Candidatus Omnitrophota bacterium]